MTTRSISRSGLLISVCLAGCGSTAPASSVVPSAPGAELALIGGDIHTMDPAHPHATALAIGGGKLLAVGSDAEIEKLVAPATRKIDLHGATVTPGLIDAHAHLYGLGTMLAMISVRDATSERAAAQIVADAGRDAAWLVGRGWDQTRWPGAQFPTKASLDAVVKDRPVMLRRIDGHAAWLNSAALARSGITKTTPDPAGGKILRDARGEATGVLLDNAMDLVDHAIGPPTPAQITARITAAAKLAVAAGITGIHEMGIDDDTVDAYAKLAADHALPLRIYAYYAARPDDPRANQRLKASPAAPTDRFTLRGVKFFADGALGSRGARLYAPYDDDPKNIGLWVTEPAVLSKNIDDAVDHGWQVAVHAIGDAAVGATLDGFVATSAKHRGDLRLRVEHDQIIAPDDIAKMVQAHAIASMQPTHATSDMRWAEARIGKQRILGAYAWRTMLDRNIPLAAGSDFPIEEVAPILGIYAAVTRQDVDGNPAGGWYPAQRLSLDEAIGAFTRGAAYAEFAEASRGVLAVGRAADVTVFDAPFTVDKSLATRKVALTILDGQITYEAAR